MVHLGNVQEGFKGAINQSQSVLMLNHIDCSELQNAFQVYKDMHENDIFLGVDGSLAMLRACSKLKDGMMGLKVCADIIYTGLDSNAYINCSLVGMFGKCGFLDEAQKMFDKMPNQNVALWNSLIIGYVDNGFGEAAMELLKQMEQSGVPPNSVTFISILKTCNNTKALERGQQLHNVILKKGLDAETYVGNALVCMFGKCGSIMDAHSVFNSLKSLDIVSWNTLLTGYVEQGLGKEALRCFEWMQRHDVSPDVITFVCCSKAISKNGTAEWALLLYAEVILRAMETNTYMGCALVDMIANAGSLVAARYVFDRLPFRDVVIWNALITAYAEHSMGKEALNSFELMQLDGIFPNAVTYASIFKVCGMIGAVDRGRGICALISGHDLDKDVFVGSSLLDMFVKCGSLSEAKQVFDRLITKNVVSWSILITGYAEHGLGEEALECFGKMQEEGVIPNDITYIACLKACGIIGDIERGTRLRNEVAECGLERELHVGSALVDMFAKLGLLEEARDAFVKLQERNAVSWNALIGGHVENELNDEALDYFDQMQHDGVCSDAITYTSCIKACSQIGLADRGQEFYNDVIIKGFDSDPFLGSALIDMYGAWNFIAEAEEVFSKVAEKTVAVWSTMIKAYGMNNKGDMAVQCFESMQTKGVKVDVFFFLCLLVACSHANMLEKGREYFDMMKKIYKVKPTMDHYSCMVDLLARTGHTHEAERLIETMECHSSKEMWLALLGACKLYGELQLAMRCFQHLFMVHPEDATAYLLMANIYGNAAWWDDMIGVEVLRKKIGAQKKPARAAIELNNEVHYFGIHSQISEVKPYLKRNGYIPDIDSVSKYDPFKLSL